MGKLQIEKKKYGGTPFIDQLTEGSSCDGVKTVQIRLKQPGYYPGKIDGVFD